MKLEDFISKSIQEYPSLYKDVDYEKSALKVLNHVFFVIGNNFSLANTLILEEGGYVVSPHYDEDGHRLLDRSYGADKYPPIPENYFDCTAYQLIGEALDYTERYLSNREIYLISNKILRTYGEPRLIVASGTYPFSPYGICHYSLAWKVHYDNVFIQDDWREGLDMLCERAKNYYKDKKQYSQNVFYRTENWKMYREKQLTFLNEYLKSKK